MLTIRKAQIEVFKQSMEERFRQDLQHNLRARFGDRLDQVSEQDLQSRIELAIEEAAGYRIRTPEPVRLYSYLRVVFDREFESMLSWMQPILEAEDLTPGLKLEQIYSDLQHSTRFRSFLDRAA